MIVSMRHSLVIVLTLLTASACAQEKVTKMIPGASQKQLVAETDESQDGIAQIILGELFKPGPTEYKRVGAAGLKDAPPLPTGYSLLKDLAYDVRTEAITAGHHVTVFRVASVASESEFNKLGILHLERDEMSPNGSSWAEVLIFPGGWDRHFNQVTRAQYDSLQPDFKSRRISAITTQLGLFVIASYQEMEPRGTEPLTKMDVAVSSSPKPVMVGQEVVHTIVLENKGPKAAAEVNLKYELNTDFEYLSATTDRGSCKQSILSSGRVICYLGAIDAGETVRITIRARVPTNILLVNDLTEAGNLLEVAFKERPNDLVEARNQLFSEHNSIISRGH